ncbi:hypothetical protein HPB52_022759 [Rhipicephalus sanguineus]|uniref:Uncharacterized protein n=1 Tax=Rhipicephalus sanguineus TaxID=34632 RepID=A0A9D4T6F2_RHISA|nr:hypothetical protein HPB52_022759 [Rhipicephalus sanguineus]
MEPFLLVRPANQLMTYGGPWTSTSRSRADARQRTEASDASDQGSSQGTRPSVLMPPNQYLALPARVLHLTAWPGLLFYSLPRASLIPARRLHGQLLSAATSVVWLMVRLAPSIVI